MTLPRRPQGRLAGITQRDMRGGLILGLRLQAIFPSLSSHGRVGSLWLASSLKRCSSAGGELRCTPSDAISNASLQEQTSTRVCSPAERDSTCDSRDGPASCSDAAVVEPGNPPRAAKRPPPALLPLPPQQPPQPPLAQRRLPSAGGPPPISPLGPRSRHATVASRLRGSARRASPAATRHPERGPSIPQRRFGPVSSAAPRAGGGSGDPARHLAAVEAAAAAGDDSFVSRVLRGDLMEAEAGARDPLQQQQQQQQQQQLEGNAPAPLSQPDSGAAPSLWLRGSSPVSVSAAAISTAAEQQAPWNVMQPPTGLGGTPGFAGSSSPPGSPSNGGIGQGGWPAAPGGPHGAPHSGSSATSSSSSLRAGRGVQQNMQPGSFLRYAPTDLGPPPPQHRLHEHQHQQHYPEHQQQHIRSPYFPQHYSQQPQPVAGGPQQLERPGRNTGTSTSTNGSSSIMQPESLGSSLWPFSRESSSGTSGVTASNGWQQQGGGSLWPAGAGFGGTLADDHVARAARLRPVCCNVRDHASMKMLLRRQHGAAYQEWVEAVDTMRRLEYQLQAMACSGPYKPFFFDLETDGLGSEDQILEVAFRTTGPPGDSQPRTFERLVRPLTPHLNQRAQEAHGIKMDQLEGQPLWPTVGTDLIRWVYRQLHDSHGGDCVPVFIGHNIQKFDLRRLGTWLAHLGLKVPRRWAFVDTYVLAADLNRRGLLPQSDNLKLGGLREALGIPAPQREHRAGDDVAVNVQVFRALAALWTEAAAATTAGASAGGSRSGSSSGPGSAAARAGVAGAGPASSGASPRPPRDYPDHHQRQLRALLASGSSFTGEWFPLVKYEGIYGTDPVLQGLAQAEQPAVGRRGRGSAVRATTPMHTTRTDKSSSSSSSTATANTAFEIAATSVASTADSGAAAGSSSSSAGGDGSSGSSSAVAGGPGGAPAATAAGRGPAQGSLAPGAAGMMNVDYLTAEGIAASMAEADKAIFSKSVETDWDVGKPRTRGRPRKNAGTATPRETLGDVLQPPAAPALASAALGTNGSRGSREDDPATPAPATAAAAAASAAERLLEAPEDSTGAKSDEGGSSEVPPSVDGMEDGAGSDGEEDEEAARFDGAGAGINPSALLPWALDDPAEAVEAAVAKGLAALAAEEVDIVIDESELSGAWLPFTTKAGDLGRRGRGPFTAGQLEKLASAELSTLLQVLLYTPRQVREYSRSIDPRADGDQLVSVEGRLASVGRLNRSGGGRGVWFEVVVEVPSDAPGAPAHRVRAARYFPGRGRWLEARAEAEKSAMEEAMAFGADVEVRCRLQHGPNGDLQATLSSPEPSITVLPTRYTPLSEMVARRRRLPPPMEVVYPKCKKLGPADVAGPGGIAERALDAVRRALLFDQDDAAAGGGWAAGGQEPSDPLPPEAVDRYEMMGWCEALRALHSPRSLEEHRAARRRVAFQEMFLGQLAALLERRRLTADPGKLLRADPSPPSPAPGAAAAAAAAAAPPSALGPSQAFKWPISITSLQPVEAARKVLPYTLTNSQQRVLGDVLCDLAGPGVMMRLLQGDVGCGKTVLAMLAMLAAAGSGYQALLMAPTELLAEQHYQTLWGITEQMPVALRPRVALITNSLKPKERRELSGRVAAGHIDLAVGTQAVLSQKWARLGLVVIDEQHKFGVRQREQLSRNVGHPVHTLLMTATPIPRTLALVQYGSLVLSCINEMPPGRRPIETRVVVDNRDGREQVYAAIREELEAGGRVYIVCPLVASIAAAAGGGSGNSSGGDVSDGEGPDRGARGGGGGAPVDPRRTVVDEYERLTGAGVFGPQHRVGLLHGRMSGDEKARALKEFSSGETPVLIASTVVEVGIDEPEASVMLVENANRFGMAQLHQLRGRVGRGSRESRCFLMTPEGDAAAHERLSVMERSHNGLHIAEADLRSRGPGDPFGTKQSGSKGGALSALCMQELRANPALMEHARAAAAEVLGSQRLTPQLKAALLAYGFWQAGSGGAAARGARGSGGGGSGGGGVAPVGVGSGSGKVGISGA